MVYIIEPLLKDASKKGHYGPYPQLHHKIKMAQRVWVVCTQNLWRELANA